MDKNNLDELVISSRERRLAGAERPDRDPALTRIRRGFHRPKEAQLTAEEAHRLRVLATAAAREPNLVFSHVSAAAVWGAPLLASDLGEVHAIQPGRPRRTTAGVRVHPTALPDEQVAMTASGLLVTSREWTAIHLAATLELPNSLLPLDHLVRAIAHDSGCEQAAVIDALIGEIPPRFRGRNRAEANLRLVDIRSGSAGESLSRGQMVLIGVPAPALQVRFMRDDGPGVDVVDFDWPALGAFGEFDGKGKYFREELRGARTPDEVLWEEKVREDRVRSKRPRAARWGWDVALSRRRLAAVLAAAGVRRQG